MSRCGISFGPARQRRGTSCGPGTACRNSCSAGGSGHRDGMKTWTSKHLAWVKTLRLEQPALAATLLDYLTEVDHARERIERVERAIDHAIEAAPGVDPRSSRRPTVAARSSPHFRRHHR